jgi:hypothetical protein
MTILFYDPARKQNYLYPTVYKILYTPIMQHNDEYKYLFGWSKENKWGRTHESLKCQFDMLLMSILGHCHAEKAECIIKRLA